MSLEEDIVIELFLKDKLPESEKKVFLKRLGNDLDFKKRVDFQKQLHETLDENSWSFIENNNSNVLIKKHDELFKGAEVEKIKAAISNANKEYKKKNKVNSKIIYLAAASVAILIAVYSLFFTINNTPEELYAEYIATNELSSNISRDGYSDKNNLILAETYFKEKEYTKALPIFKKELNSHKNNASIYIYAAISQMELNKPKDAEITLNTLTQSDLIDAQKGYWYKSLLYLKTNQIYKAKSELEFIIKNSYFKHKQAQELLDKIN